MQKSFLECLALGCLLSSSTAWADQGAIEHPDTFTFVVGAGLTRDDNLFRAPAGQEVSDELRTTTLGFKIDKSYSLQRFIVDAIWTDYSYRDNSYLDYTGKNLNAAWAWKLSPSLYGNLSSSKVESLISFVDYVPATPELRRNVRTVDKSRFDVEWEAMGPLHLVSSVSHFDQTNSQTFIEESNYSAKSGEFGVKYVTPSKNSIALVGRKVNGDYNRAEDPATLQDSGFTQTESEVRFVWNPTVKSNATGRVAYLEREHDNFSERNYSGYVGSADLTWGITDKVNFLINVRRDLNSYQESRSVTDSYSNNYVADSFTLNPVWNMTEKTTLSYSYTQQRRDFEGVEVSGDPLRQDRFKYNTISFGWKPRSFVQVGLNFQKLKRDSNDDNFDFKADIVYLTVRFNI
jgi:exopolysaccharide biosynthesis operon protein EpsL